MDWFTLRALADDWHGMLAGARLDDAWTQSASELSLGLTGRDGAAHVLRVVCDPALTVAFRTPGGGRQKRNTADVFPDLAGRRVEAVRVADRDRHVVLDLDDGSALQALLFGSRPTVLHVAGGQVLDAFVHATQWLDEPAPAPRAAPDPETAGAVRERWPERAKTVAVAVRRAAPLLPPRLAAATARSAGFDASSAPPAECPDALAEAVAALRAALDAPRPVVVWRGDLAEAVLPLSPDPLGAGLTVEPFETADAAVRVYARRALGQRQFQSLYRPVEAALASAAARRARSAEAMLTELAAPSRADRYEAWGHLLMAQPTPEGPGRESATLPDLLGGEGDVEVPLDPALSAIENAERYYDKARRTRRARASAEARWEAVQADAEATQALLDRLHALDRVPDLRDFLEGEADAIARWTGGRATDAAEPFRRIALPGGAEALVGKNAKSNAHLTTRVARPHDLWLHARGVPGSHVVVRRATRTAEVPRAAVEAAARIAAHYSDARTQSLAPVIVTERKYVRPVKGGPPGLVRVDRETVLDVEPGLP